MHRKSAYHLKVTWYIVRLKNKVYKNTQGGGGEGFDFQPMVYKAPGQGTSLQVGPTSYQIDIVKCFGDKFKSHVFFWIIILQSGCVDTIDLEWD